MRRIALLGLAVGFGLTTALASGQEPRSQDRAIDEPPHLDAKHPPGTAPRPAPVDPMIVEATAARTIVTERLRLLSRPTEGEKARDRAEEARIAALQEIYKARERLLATWEEARRSRQAVEKPEITPEAEAAELKESLDRARVRLAQAVKDPASLLPDVFRVPAAKATDADLAAMKERLAEAQEAADDLKKECDTLAAVANRKVGTPVAAARADREEIRKRISALGPRGAELEAALASAASSDEREIARERLINLDWEGRAEAERLKEAESHIDLETRRAASSEIRIQVRKAELDLARTALDLLQARYRERVDLQLNDLKRASATEGARAETAGDPLERYRARRAKELNDQKALLNESERELLATPDVALADQTEKADKSAEDFKHLKELVTGGRSTALVAQRLNNSFRRLGNERSAIVRNELARISQLQTRYENELTDVELDQLNDVQGDHALRDNLIASLPPARSAEARKLFEENERANREVMEARRRVLTKLASRADLTRQQVLRRIKILDDQHAFVRTHLFWVRESQPMGASTVEQIRRESRDLTRTVLGIVTEPWMRSPWARVSSDFGLASFGLIGLPYLLYRARKALRRILDQTRAGRAGLTP